MEVQAHFHSFKFILKQIQASFTNTKLTTSDATEIEALTTANSQESSGQSQPQSASLIT